VIIPNALKKALNILITLNLLVATVGFTIHKHYSRGELYSYSVFTSPESCCEGVCNCCDEVSETFQLRLDYTANLDQVQLKVPEITHFTAFAVEPVRDCIERVVAGHYFDQDLPPPDLPATLSLLQTFLL
jgi:hypothetical protein